MNSWRAQGGLAPWREPQGRNLQSSSASSMRAAMIDRWAWLRSSWDRCLGLLHLLRLSCTCAPAMKRGPFREMLDPCSHTWAWGIGFQHRGSLCLGMSRRGTCRWCTDLVRGLSSCCALLASNGSYLRLQMLRRRNFFLGFVGVRHAVDMIQSVQSQELTKRFYVD